MLAEHVSITRRSIVSWETGDRLPSIGMVVLLLDALFPDETLSLYHELLCAYIADDVEREAQRQRAKHTSDGLLRQQRLQRVIEQILALPGKQGRHEFESRHHQAEPSLTARREQLESPQPPSPAESEPTLEPLFTLMTQLQHHPELIPVARDFIREMVADE
jgi:DNA-binding XRE family transcriptional regulator